ncbi:nmrA-like family domain-containing protein 1 [Acanthaster planci]|uniref:NmrA-like family domain-containing protein 1 n=1 Tax=Acanthaster planci TaxID=133434 RepID=A0A8B7ZYK6_ACAPL|nr:nmrA-like family domain-containing protein 1 [Acanthaster planci]XP_022110612.1 nmrA-like family domain-containing protein 1 [Acanthaster planci]XP_022110613.1 nmrA-like family domain-containing protein 1 [Acanthaster planci]
MKKVVTVFGATGQQGGSVVRALLEQPDNFHVRAVTRNPTSPKSLALRAAGCQLVQAELAQTESLIPILQGADCCFLVTRPPVKMVQEEAAKDEYQYGMNVANACMAVGLPHLMFTTLPNCEKITGAAVPWSDSKARIAEYFKEKGLPLTAITLPDFYENYLSVLKPQKVEDDVYNLEIPTGEQAYSLINISYLGEAVRHIITHRDEYINKDITLATDRLTVGEIADIMNTHLQPMGKTVRNAEFTLDQTREKYKHRAGIEDLVNWYKFILAGPADPQYEEYKDIELGRKLMPSAKSFDEWIRENKEALAAALS